MAIREGRWDCPSCGSKSVYGRHVDCPGCGKPRPAGIRFYLTDDAPVITDAAQLAEAAAGADWICEHCGASTRATQTDCGGCGAARGTSPSQPVIDYASANVPRSGDGMAADIPVPDATPAAGPPDPPSPAPPAESTPAAPGPSEPSEPSGETLAAPAPAGTAPATNPPAGVAPSPPTPEEPLTARTAVLGCAWGCWPVWATLLALAFGVVDNWNDARRARLEAARIDPGTVVDVRWERTIDLQQRAVVEGESFSLPDSVQVLSQRRAVERYDEQFAGYTTETRQVERGTRTGTGSRTRTREVSERVRTGSRTSVCGQRDRGNGYFEDIECEEPVYETQTHTETYEEPTTYTEPDYETVTEQVPVYRSVPVYGTLYRWRGPQWQPLPPVVARGGTDPPAWPEVAPAPNRRVAGRKERYSVVVRSRRGTETFELPAEQWARHRVGQLVGVGLQPDRFTRRLAPADSVTACVKWRAGRRWRRPPASYQCDQRLPPAPARPSAGAPAPR